MSFCTILMTKVHPVMSQAQVFIYMSAPRIIREGWHQILDSFAICQAEKEWLVSASGVPPHTRAVAI